MRLALRLGGTGQGADQVSILDVDARQLSIQVIGVMLPPAAAFETPFLPRLITMSIPYQPTTKENVAALLAVSKRTVDNWIADGTIIAPTAIGRRVYWHPDAFFR